MNQTRRSFVWCTYRDWSFRILEGLLDLHDWNAALIVTTDSCVSDLGRFESLAIPVLRIDPKNGLKKDGLAHKKILDIRPATIFHYGWSWVVPREILRLCPNVTLHPGKLPKDRGGSPLQNQIRNGETWTYANILQLSEKLDEGPVYLREKISLEGEIDDVWARMTATGCRLTRAYLRGMADGNLTPTPQPDEELSFHPRVKPEQAELKPDEHTALQMHNIIRSHSETDPNTYVRPAFLPLAHKKLIITRAALAPRPSEDSGLTLTSASEIGAEDLHSLCSAVNNGEANLALADRNGERLYIKRFHISNL